MPFQNILLRSCQALWEVDVKLDHQVAPLLRVFGEREPLARYGPPHAGLDNVCYLHVTRFPVYRRHGY